MTGLLRAGDGPSLEVYRLTEMLCSLGYLAGPGDKFSEAVSEAVFGFQLTYGLGADGIVGPMTWGKLTELVGGPRIDSLIIHHTAGSRQNTVEDIDTYHRQMHPTWGGIAYQYALRQHRDGLPLVEIAKGREHDGGPWLGLAGTHVMGEVNSHSVAVVLIGDFDRQAGKPVPEPMYQTLIALLGTWCVAWDLGPSDIYGHHEVPGNATSCPGDLIDLDRVRLDVGDLLIAIPGRGVRA